MSMSRVLALRPSVCSADRSMKGTGVAAPLGLGDAYELAKMPFGPCVMVASDAFSLAMSSGRGGDPELSDAVSVACPLVCPLVYPLVLSAVEVGAGMVAVAAGLIVGCGEPRRITLHVYAASVSVSRPSSLPPARWIQARRGECEVGRPAGRVPIMLTPAKACVGRGCRRRWRTQAGLAPQSGGEWSRGNRALNLGLELWSDREIGQRSAGCRNIPHLRPFS